MKSLLLFIAVVFITSFSIGQEVCKPNQQPTENKLVGYPGEPADSLFQNNPEFENIRVIAPKKQSTDKLGGAGKFFVFAGTTTGLYFLGRTTLRGISSGIKNSVGGAFNSN